MDSLGSIFNGGGGIGGTPPFLPGSSGSGGTNPTSSGSWLTKLLPLILAGGGIMGTVGNIQANSARNSVLKQQMDYTKMLQNMTPAQIMEGITSLQQPLSKNLTNTVGNTVQGQLAERGLSQAPGIYASSLAQGLAPYQLQEQQLAQDAFFKKLGLPISSRPSPFGPFPQTTNTSQLWQALLQNFMRGKVDQPNQLSESGLINTLWPSGLTPDTSSGSDFPSTQPGGG